MFMQICLLFNQFEGNHMHKWGTKDSLELGSKARSGEIVVIISLFKK